LSGTKVIPHSESHGYSPLFPEGAVSYCRVLGLSLFLQDSPSSIMMWCAWWLSRSGGTRETLQGKQETPGQRKGLSSANCCFSKSVESEP